MPDGKVFDLLLGLLVAAMAWFFKMLHGRVSELEKETARRNDMLREVDKLSDELKEHRSETTKGFDRLDATIRTSIATISSRLDAVSSSQRRQ